MSHIILNHTLMQMESARISPHDRGFRYGDGLFETIRVHQGVPYRFEWHMNRLERGLEATRIVYDTNTLAAECKQLMEHMAMPEGLLRIQITRGVGGRGYLPDPGMQATSVIEMLPLPALPERPVDLWESSYTRMPLSALPVHYKLCQGMNSTLARLEAADYGCFDALMLGENGYIAETSSANVFWLKGGTLYTSALSTGALDGAMRSALLELIPVQETCAELSALAEAEAVCLTNTAWTILPVGCLKPSGLLWKSTALATELRGRFMEGMAEYSRRHRTEWRADTVLA